MKGVLVVGLSRHQVRTSLFLQLLRAFNVNRDDFSSIFTKMLGGNNDARLETQAYIHEYEEVAVIFGHEQNEFTSDYEAIAESIKEKMPPWLDGKDIVSVWFRTDYDVLIFYK
jgi:hypothetical protein